MAEYVCPARARFAGIFPYAGGANRVKGIHGRLRNTKKVIITPARTQFKRCHVVRRG